MMEISIAKQYRTESGCEVTILHTGLAGEYSVLGLVHGRDGSQGCSWTKDGKCERPEWNLVEVSYPEVNLNFKYETSEGFPVTLVSDKGLEPYCILGIIHRDTWDFPWKWNKYGQASFKPYDLKRVDDE